MEQLYTINELGNQMLYAMHELRKLAVGDEERRDLSLAITHLEDSLTRYNGSRYWNKGTWHRVDPDK